MPIVCSNGNWEGIAVYAFLALLSQGEGTEINISIRENELGQLNCESTRSFELISTYFEIAYSGGHSKTLNTASCRKNVKSHIVEMCSALPCTVNASTEIFGDPCPGEVKNLYVKYRCQTELDSLNIGTRGPRQRRWKRKSGGGGKSSGSGRSGSSSSRSSGSNKSGSGKTTGHDDSPSSNSNTGGRAPRSNGVGGNSGSQSGNDGSGNQAAGRIRMGITNFVVVFATVIFL